MAKKKSEIAVKDHKNIQNPQPLTAITCATQESCIRKINRAAVAAFESTTYT